LCAGGFSSARGSEVFHETKIICWETVRASRGLTVGCFPPSEAFSEHRLDTCESWPKRRARERTAIWRVGLAGGRLDDALDDSRKRATPAAFPQ
jgi:hypothetical protein